MKNKPEYAIESVDNALHLAQLLVLDGPMRVTEAAAHLGVAPSTAHRLLAMLVYRDFAGQGEDRLYRPGPMMRSSGRAGAPPTALRRVAAPHLRRLVRDVNETANLVVLTGNDVRFVSTVECTHVLRAGDRAGKAIPAHLASAGQAMLALLDEQGRESILRRLDEAERTRTRRQLAAARRNGYALNRQRTEAGLTAVGVAVHGSDAPFVAGISLSMPSVRFDKHSVPRWVRELSDCAAAIGRDLGNRR